MRLFFVLLVSLFISLISTASHAASCKQDVIKGPQMGETLIYTPVECVTVDLQVLPAVLHSAEHPAVQKPIHEFTGAGTAQKTKALKRYLKKAGTERLYSTCSGDTQRAYSHINKGGNRIRDVN